MRNLLLFGLAALAAHGASAQVYQCPSSGVRNLQQQPCWGGKRLDEKPYRASLSNVSAPGPSVPTFIQPPAPPVTPATQEQIAAVTGIPVVYSCDNPSPEMQRLRQDVNRRTITKKERADLQARIDGMSECPAQVTAQGASNRKAR